MGLATRCCFGCYRGRTWGHDDSPCSERVVAANIHRTICGHNVVGRVAIADGRQTEKGTDNQIKEGARAKMLQGRWLSDDNDITTPRIYSVPRFRPTENSDSIVYGFLLIRLFLLLSSSHALINFPYWLLWLEFCALTLDFDQVINPSR